MLEYEAVRFPSCVIDVTSLTISCGAIFHLELSTMTALSLNLEGSSVSSPFLRYPDDISEATILLEGIYSLA